MNDTIKVGLKAQKSAQKFFSIRDALDTDNSDEDTLKTLEACEAALLATIDYCKYLKDRSLYESVKHEMVIGNRNLRSRNIRAKSGQKKLKIEEGSWEDKVIRKILTMNLADNNYPNKLAIADINCVIAFDSLKSLFLEYKINDELLDKSLIEKNPIRFDKNLEIIIREARGESLNRINEIRKSESISKATFDRWKANYKASHEKTFNLQKISEPDYVEFNE